MLLQAKTISACDALLRPRYELIPIKGVMEQAAHLPHYATVTVTCSPVHGIEPTLSVVEQLSARGFVAVPHISARLVRDAQHLDHIVDRLTIAGVEDIYVIGGDAREPAGQFESAGQLLEALHARGHPFQEIGIAAYPEGHPLVPEGILWNSLKHKQPYATYFVTQMCFDTDVIRRWLTDARDRGIHLPAVIGIPGVVDMRHLMRIAARIGVGQSTRFLRRNLGLLSKLFRPGPYTPDRMIDELLPMMDDERLNIQGLHIYTFNYADKTETWRGNRVASTS